MRLFDRNLEFLRKQTNASSVKPYKKANNDHGCCISDGKFHQRCESKLNFAKCRRECDYDFNCKGYTHNGTHCEVATTSACTIGKVKDLGNQNDLIEYETCGSKNGGCFIKDNDSKNDMSLIRLLF